jgi:hypothetical protein
MTLPNALKVPDSVGHLDPDVVVEVLSRHSINVSDAAAELGVASADLRKLLWAKPHLSDAAVEIEERRLDLAEKNILEALHSDSKLLCGQEQPSCEEQGMDHYLDDGCRIEHQHQH